MSVWERDIPTEGEVDLPPDPRVLAALGRNHSLETALADLVDNSVDAHASEVLIRFIQDGIRLVGLFVIDNGDGIAPKVIDAAMTVGGRRTYTAADLGQFGLGLKAASFSQADSLTVLSRSAGQLAVGRRVLRGADRGFLCDLIPAAFVAQVLDHDWPLSLTPSGTVVRWDNVRGFPTFDDRDQVQEYLSRTISHLQGHLGLMFHRILGRGQVRISIDVEDTLHGVGVSHQVAPLDPFGYHRAPDGWPKTLTGHTAGTTVKLHCHIWPGRSNLPQYRLPGGAEARQGLYIYRRDRLVHAGGWEGIHAGDRKLQLARIAVDVDGDVTGLFILNPEKTRVSAGPNFAALVHSARDVNGTTVADYLRAAEQTWIASNRRATRRSAVLPPGRGMEPSVCREIREELPQLNDPPLNIQWKAFTGDDFLQIDRGTSTLWLNRAYRQALLGGRRGSLNDLPLMKALLFLLTENLFHGSHLGKREKDNVQLWQEILTVAAKAERSMFEARQ